MESTVSLLAVMIGINTGIMLLDGAQRRRDRKELKLARAEADKAAKALSDLHNKQVEHLKSISEKVSSHDMMIKAVTQAPNNNAMKRF
jgi:hypothetical protein